MKSSFSSVLFLISLISLQSCDLAISAHDDTTSYTPFMAAASACDKNQLQNEYAKTPDQVKGKVRDMNNATALHLAIGHNCMEAAAYLLNIGADANAKEADDVTPLHLAAQQDNVDLIKLLLKHDANINTLDANHWTPLDRAEKRNKVEAIKFLKEHGAEEGQQLQ